MNTKEHELNAEGGVRNAELFEVAASSKPALLQARERLAQAEREQIACDMAVDAMGPEAVPELKAAEERVRHARKEVHRLEWEALQQLLPEVAS